MKFTTLVDFRGFFVCVCVTLERFSEYCSLDQTFSGGSMLKSLPPNARRHRRCRFDPWVGKILWRRRKWQPIPVFLPGESHGQRSLTCYSPGGHKESDMTEGWSMHIHFFRTKESDQVEE